MEQYLSQLQADLHAATLHRWQQCPPQHYQTGLRDEMNQPPGGYVEHVSTENEPFEFILDYEASIAEMENWVAGKPEVNMYDLFGMSPEQFPPTEKLNDLQVQQLVKSLLGLWTAYNFVPTLPDKVPARLLYPLLGCAVLLLPLKFYLCG